MLAGLPVIAPGFADEVAAVVRESGCGVLVDPADPEAIAAAIAALAADPARCAALGTAGRHAATLGRFGRPPRGDAGTVRLGGGGGAPGRAVPPPRAAARGGGAPGCLTRP
jgi:hypothetical protein